MRAVFIARRLGGFSRLFSTRTLVVAQHDNKSLHDSTFNSVTAAKSIGEVSVLVAGNQCEGVAKQAAEIEGVKQVYLSENAAFEHFIAESLTQLLLDLQKKQNFSHIFSAATAHGKNFMPRVAAKLDVQAISDVISVKSADTFVRPIYAGNAISTVQSSDKVRVVTIRSTAFNKAGKASSAAPIEKYASSPDWSKTTWVKDELTKSDRPELGSAKVVVAGGRGLASGDNFKLLHALADTLNAAVGASRAAVDAGYVPNDYQIGQTGKVVAPDLYVAVGISGAIQHLAGMKDSKTIVAINKDTEAPIFQVCDYGLVDDLFKAVPALTKAIQSSKK